jgi:uncharacterized protein YcnI
MKYLGYHHDLKTLPIQPGDTVEVPKGTPFLSTHPKRHKGITGRTQKVKVRWLNCGNDISEGDKEYERRHGRSVDHLQCIERKGEKRYVLFNPVVVWAGSGGYWVEVDINLVKKVEA